MQASAPHERKSSSGAAFFDAPATRGYSRGILPSRRIFLLAAAWQAVTGRVMNERGSAIPARLRLRVGEWVVVRSKEEIVATLDAAACLDALPFQPEMFAFCGRRMRVAKVAHKTCNNIKKDEGRGRRMLNAVHLEGARCDGAAHGGCEADCVFFWKESWLRRENDAAAGAALPGACTEATVFGAAKAPGEEGSDDPAWVCQTTRLYDATLPLHPMDARQYVRDVTTGNHSAWAVTKLLCFAAFRKLLGIGVGYRFLVGLHDAFQKVTGGKPYPRGEGRIADGTPTPAANLDLKPGEWVEIRSEEEIMATITRRGFNRGMRYDVEMSQYCGERHRVQMVVQRLIHEETGKMVTMKNPCIQLEDVYCRARCTDERLGCPRASNTYWREIWLRRVEGAGGAEGRPAQR